MGWGIAYLSLAAAAVLLADQRRGKVLSGDDSWWDWNAHAAPSELARDTIWSHDAWAFGLGVLVPLGLGAVAFARAGATPRARRAA